MKLSKRGWFIEGFIIGCFLSYCYLVIINKPEPIVFYSLYPFVFIVTMAIEYFLFMEKEVKLDGNKNNQELQVQ
jgi:hypothetical protein